MGIIKVKKHSGELEAFDINKLISSLRRSQADEDLVLQVARNIEDQLVEGMSTKAIYQKAFSMLKSHSRVSASKYNLKKALMELGPTGFPFERLVGKLLEFEGFDTQVGVIVEGNCVSHEVDVIADNDKSRLVIECKYHSDQGRICNVKTPLYVHSRFLDIKNKWENQDGQKAMLYRGGVYTSTRFTSDAIRYGTCVGLVLVSWDFPQNDSLKERIDRAGMYPLTALATLTRSEKNKLLDSGIILCREISQNPDLLGQLGFSRSRQKKILEDSRALCMIDYVD